MADNKSDSQQFWTTYTVLGAGLRVVASTHFAVI